MVWPCQVEVFDVLLDHPVKLPVADDEEVIEPFSPHAPQEPFADCVGSWSAVRRLQHFNGASLRDSGETVAELAIPVANQETRG